MFYSKFVLNMQWGNKLDTYLPLHKKLVQSGKWFVADSDIHFKLDFREICYLY